MKRRLLLGLAAAAAVGFGVQAHADTSEVKAGVLTCNVSSGWGLVFGSSRDLDCTFDPVSGPPEKYKGTIKKYGIDVGYQQGGIMVWGVFAPSATPASLTGDYGGVTAGGSVGVGASANALVGGSNDSISLQPVSIEGMSGLNIAAGVASISLVAQPD